MWLLHQEVLDTLAKFNDYQVSDERLQQIEARYTFEGDDRGNRLLSIVGKTAKINVKGVLTKHPNIIAMLFGGGNTTYAEIEDALLLAADNKDVDSINLQIDSGGGTVAGLFELIGTMQEVKRKKPITALVDGLAASAAYAIASQAETITTKTKADVVGSIGIAASYPVREDVVTITSTKAPKKRPDVTTDAGVKMVREELDAIHDLFVEAIAEGRSVSVDKVNAEFGQGGTFLANEALKRGMVDQVGMTVDNPTVTKTADKGGETIEVQKMNLDELKAKHPELYQAAFEQGVTAEKERVNAHLNAGKEGGNAAMTVALEAIEKGDSFNQTYQSKYMTAAMKNQFAKDTDADSQDAGANGGQRRQENTAEDDEADVVALVAEMSGV